MAAASMTDAAVTQRRIIVETLAKFPDGLISDEVDVIQGWRAATSSRRMHELVAMGLVESTGKTRLTRGKRSAMVYRLIEERTAPSKG
jgi:hypothetical protein